MPARDSRLKTLRQTFQLLALLMCGAATVGQLAGALGLHTRSVRRYIAALRAIGVPIASMPGGGYRLPRQAFLAWLRRHGV